MSGTKPLHSNNVEVPCARWCKWCKKKTKFVPHPNQIFAALQVAVAAQTHMKVCTAESRQRVKECWTLDCENHPLPQLSEANLGSCSESEKISGSTWNNVTFFSLQFLSVLHLDDANCAQRHSVPVYTQRECSCWTSPVEISP